MSPVAKDGMDGNRLTFEKIWPIFSSFDATCSKNPQEFYYGYPSLIKFISYLRRSLTEAFCL